VHAWACAVMCLCVFVRACATFPFAACTFAAFHNHRLFLLILFGPRVMWVSAI
jgi:hypothetical protein